jgi:hypothetical protein
MEKVRRWNIDGGGKYLYPFCYHRHPDVTSLTPGLSRCTSLDGHKLQDDFT